MSISRRRFLHGLGAAAGSLWLLPRPAMASAGSERRFVFVIQRGAADGLNTVIPYADPGYARLRGSLAIASADAIKLDGTFALHPALGELGKRYAAGEALFVHAVASPYRERSHFDGQNVLESGADQPYAVRDGWLNRLSALLPAGDSEPIAVSPTVPLALRGNAPVSSYADSALPEVSDDLLMRVERLYADDAQLHELWASAMAARALAGDDGSARQTPARLGKLAATFLSQANGPRIAMLETGGWDTHNGQNPRLALRLRGLDELLAALRTGLGTAWGDTVVVVATEFGRTVAVNGTQGTDHGTASVAMLLGGAVNGGRVVTDWPGLDTASLHEGRDLKPTIELDAVLASAAAQTFGLDPGRVASVLFPACKGLRPLDGLIRAA
ncbi:DUF1501 domain-containing protein [Dokdonella sp.]|uniref:DUF1501 domain-containing protein n=1 Tax=Dokdonella sp. TaxID=2291710 RepID=UPI0025C319FA|nr:DUF1501 domain-containing protein [Dokdonella sp.]MBX3693309.1 DUF1501 domain-containing protein [Dokdonella sp.]MCW5568716.1 DUF1501 domain-containing protein [Dokdonella sp.]